MSPTLKNARLELRLTPEQKESIEIAAVIEGRSVSDFTATVLTQRAEEVIRQDRQLKINGEQFDQFLNILEQPGRTIEGLKQLLARESIFVD